MTISATQRMKVVRKIMKYYITKNGKQLGPFTENEVMVKIASGETSPEDLCIPHGGTEWKPLSKVLPNAVSAPSIAKPATAASVPRKRRWGMIVGILGAIVACVLVIGGILGFLAYRNLFPGDSLEDLPDQVKSFKLQDRSPGHGDVWGSKVWYGGMYSIPPSNDFLLYLIDVHNSEPAAKAEMETDLAKDCSTGDTPLRFSFTKEGKEIGVGATCYRGFYVQKGNRVVTVAKSGDSISIEDMAEFMENLPFVAGSKMVPKNKD